MLMSENEFWFNMKTGEVESGKQSLALYRIGPFETFELAENALEIIAARSAEWLEDDEQRDEFVQSEKDSSADGKFPD